MNTQDSVIRCTRCQDILCEGVLRTNRRALVCHDCAEKMQEQAIYYDWLIASCRRVMEDVHTHEVVRGYETDAEGTSQKIEVVEEKDLTDSDVCSPHCVGCRSETLLEWLKNPVPHPKWREAGMVPDDYVPAFEREKKT